jgi:hypothetical protein
MQLKSLFLEILSIDKKKRESREKPRRFRSITRRATALIRGNVKTGHPA